MQQLLAKMIKYRTNVSVIRFYSHKYYRYILNTQCSEKNNRLFKTVFIKLDTMAQLMTPK
jgi:hypothetical protein